MNPLRSLLAFSLAFSAALGAERDVVRTFAVDPGCTVSIDTYRGGITVTESDAAEVRIAVRLEIGADDEAEAEQIMRGLQLEFTSSGDAVTMLARHPAETRVRFVWEERKQIEPTFRVTVPRQCNLKLRTLTGSVIVGNVVGNLEARAENGAVFFRNVSGSVFAAAEYGDVVVSHCVGSLTAQVLRGVIRVGTVTGRCDLRNASGDIEVMAAKSDIHAYAEAGNATIGVPRDFAGQGEIRTSGGNIVMSIDSAASCEIQSSTSWLGKIDCALPLVVQAGRNGTRKLVGRLNAGNGRLMLRASGGDIKLRPGETPF